MGLLNPLDGVDSPAPVGGGPFHPIPAAGEADHPGANPISMSLGISSKPEGAMKLAGIRIPHSSGKLSRMAIAAKSFPWKPKKAKV